MEIFYAIVNCVALVAAIAVSPFMVSRVLFPRADRLSTAAATGVASLVLNTAVPLLFDALSLPLTGNSLALVHAGLFVPLFALARHRCKRSLWRPQTTGGERLFAGLMVLLALLVVPLTHLAGIDTYKWQGLATNVAVEGSIPWLIHPISLLGFTPRAYPPMQPLVLATVQLMGHLGVGGGFFVVSLLTAGTGLCLAGALGRRLFETPAQAALFAAFYVLSPVFMRYTHWATGRGFFLALYPLFVLALVNLPRAAAWPGAILSWVLLSLAHKTGLFTILLLPLACVCLPAPRRRLQLAALVLLIPAAAMALLLSQAWLLPGFPGRFLACLRTAATRLGWMLPIAAFAIACPSAVARGPLRRLTLPLLATLPLAFPPDMYGAMLALPFVTAFAAQALVGMSTDRPALQRRLAVAALLLSICGAMVIVLHRNAHATPSRVYRAARFLEQLDPRGPFRVHAPGRARVQIHAYVSGCPRFEVDAMPNSTWNWGRPPAFRRPVSGWARDWIDFGRNALKLHDVDVEWYGLEPRHYFVVIDGDGERPRDGVVLYTEDGIEILKPRGQVVETTTNMHAP